MAAKNDTSVRAPALRYHMTEREIFAIRAEAEPAAERREALL